MMIAYRGLTIMQFVAIKIDVDHDLTKLIATELDNNGKKFRRFYRAKVKAVADGAIAKLSRTPPKPRYPIRWKTEKQRRAFFATDGFGKGIPTKRTGKLQKGWKYEIIADYRDGLFYVYNDAVTRNYFSGAIVYYEQFVQGINQQPFHADTGWVRSQDVLADTLVEAEDVIIELWYEANTK